MSKTNAEKLEEDFIDMIEDLNQATPQYARYVALALAAARDILRRALMLEQKMYGSQADAYITELIKKHAKKSA